MYLIASVMVAIVQVRQSAFPIFKNMEREKIAVLQLSDPSLQLFLEGLRNRAVFRGRRGLPRSGFIRGRLGPLRKIG